MIEHDVVEDLVARAAEAVREMAGEAAMANPDTGFSQRLPAQPRSCSVLSEASASFMHSERFITRLLPPCWRTQSRIR